MLFYDYEQVPLQVADHAFAALMEQPNTDILELPTFLIKYCDEWCQEHQAFSEQDNRVAVINRLQAYIHATYTRDLAELMRSKIRQYWQYEQLRASLDERKN
jgi:hypothetical protein